MAASRRLLGASLAAAVSAGTFELAPSNICGVCRELERGLPCEHFGACEAINASAVQGGCSAFCPSPEVTEGSSAAAWGADLQTGGPEVRVTKAFGTRPYNQVRVSVITTSAEPPATAFFDHSSQFAYKWTQFYLHTALKEVEPGTTAHFTLANTDVVVSLPRQGAGVTGVLLADPCVNTPTGGDWMYCGNGNKFQTFQRTPALINAFVKDADYWSISGDNFYDRSGRISSTVWSSISLEAKSKLFSTVPGNHDYWVYGSPEAGTTDDQCGYGYMQYHAMDTKASAGAMLGSSSSPFDLSVHPDLGRPDVTEGLGVGAGCNLPAPENFLWYNQIGNVGLIGQSGAYPVSQVSTFMREACAWLAKQPGLDVALLFGHWDSSGLGATADMAMPQWYTEMAALPGCAEYNSRGMLKFIMGHTHCNDPHPHGHVDVGFRVAGWGMDGCGDYGVPVLDTTDGRIRFWYFDTSTDARYNAVMGCVQSKGWRQCTNLAVSWLDQAIVPTPTPPAPAPAPPSPPSPTPAPSSSCPSPPDNGGCCTACAYNHFCPANRGCYSAGQAGCPGTLCPAPVAANATELVV